MICFLGAPEQKRQLKYLCGIESLPFLLHRLPFGNLLRINYCFSFFRNSKSNFANSHHYNRLLRAWSRLGLVHFKIRYKREKRKKYERRQFGGSWSLKQKCHLLDYINRALLFVFQSIPLYIIDRSIEHDIFLLTSLFSIRSSLPSCNLNLLN